MIGHYRVIDIFIGWRCFFVCPALPGAKILAATWVGGAFCLLFSKFLPSLRQLQGCLCPPFPPFLSSRKKWRTISEDMEDNFGGYFGGHFRNLIAQALHLCKIKAFFMQLQVHYKVFLIFKPFLLIFWNLDLYNFNPQKQNFKYFFNEFYFV